MGAIKKKVIMIPRRNFKPIQKDCGCSQSTVYAALRFNNDSVQAQKIRRLAMERYDGTVATKTIVL